MGSALTMIGGVILILAAVATLLVGIQGGVLALVGVLAVTAPIFIGGLVLAAFGAMLDTLVAIRAAAERQAALLEQFAASRRERP